MSPFRGHFWWWTFVWALLFLLHASCYLYFFVDDEGITLVYARNLLHGRGLSYTATEGPVEGYSNFLHVLMLTGPVGLVEFMGLSRTWAFAGGKLWSLAGGAGLVVLLWQTTGRLGVPPASRTAATLLLAASGPLAVWSNSSLETVPFSLAFMLLVAAALPDIRRPVLITATAAAVVLLRIDGFLFALTWLGSCLVVGSTQTRRALVHRVLPGLASVALAYVVWRYWYFGAWLPLPLETKVAHKLFETPGAVVRANPVMYLPSFAREAGLPILAAAAFGLYGFLAPGWRRGVVALGTTLSVLLAYVSIVGDWMFGFRFLVPLLAPLALLASWGLGTLEVQRPRLGKLVAVGLVAWAAVVGWNFSAHFQTAQKKALFWAAPSVDPSAWFGEYFEAYEAVRGRAVPGATIAYHEAGFVPFMLDVENIDMLGLTSRFFGNLPTRDAIFTDVGRYYPVTPEPPHHAAHAYLVYRRPGLLLIRRTWMGTANGGHIPAEVLGGQYRLAGETTNFVIYEPAASGRHLRSDTFLENMAHPAYALEISVNDLPIAIDAAAAHLPSLWQGQGHEVNVDPAWTLRIQLREPAPVHEIYISGDAPTEDLHAEVRLSAAGTTSSPRLEASIPAGRAFVWRHVLDAPVLPDTVSLRLVSVSGATSTLRLRAVRVLGQTTALRRHLRREGIPR